MLERLHDICNDMNLSFGYSSAQEVDWSRIKASWYPYNFDAALEGGVEATVALDWKGLNDGAVQADHMLLEIPVMFV